MTELPDGERRRWTLVIPAPAEWLTANIERQRYQRGKLVKAWRQAVVFCCERDNLPKGISPVAIYVLAEYASRQPPVRDRLNLAPTIKALVDGLTPPRVFRRDGRTYRTEGYGLLPDDSDRHVLDTDWRIEPMPAGITLRYGRAIMTISDLSPSALFDEPAVLM